MLRRMFTIAFLYLKNTYTSRTTLLFSLLMPLLFTFVLGQAMEAGYGSAGEAPTSWPLLVADADQSEWSALLLERLEADPIVDVVASDEAAARAAVENEEAIAALVIPAGFGDSLAAGEPASLDFYQHPTGTARAQILAEAVNAASAELSGSLAAADLAVRVAAQVGLLEGADEAVREAYSQEAFAGAEAEWDEGAPLVVETEAVTRLETGPSFQVGATQSSPGMLVMYALFFTFGGAGSLIVERDEGTLRRLLVMPMPKGTILSGKLLGVFLGALIQMGIMVMAGQFVFGVNWGQSPAALIAMLLAYGFAGTTLGMMVAALARSAAQANAASTITVMALASLGGAWWPIEIVPQWMQQLSLALPTGWAMRGFHNIITRGLGLGEVALEAGVLAGFGVLFLAVGVLRFRYE